MNKEALKSVILVILIAFSLILSVALWNYQPSVDELQKEKVVEDTKLEGIGETNELLTLIEPEQYVFHKDQGYYSYANTGDLKDAYTDMKQWKLSSINKNPNAAKPSEGQEMVEIIFPTEIPMLALKKLVSIPSAEILNQSQSFDRIVVTHNHEEQSAGKYELFVINSKEKVNGTKLRAQLEEVDGNSLFSTSTEKDMVEQVRLADYMDEANTSDDGFNHIYISKEKRTYPSVVLQADSIPVTPLQNYLFPSSSVVTDSTSSTGERLIRDVYRHLEVMSNDKKLKYIYQIPNEANATDLGKFELLEQSREDINEHLGWTNDFKLEDILQFSAKVNYRMYFEGLPILQSLDYVDVATMYIKYEQGAIQAYARPLLQFKESRFNINSADSVGELLSGEDIAERLKKSKFKYENIQGLRIGYELKEEEHGLAYYLIPQWFVNIDGQWIAVTENTELSQNEEVS
ncbi:two-component system activity regulator YycH [Halobacillus yeomjeoni]|uniref:YycH family regulatory protein n=1 Tax=Halobacillus yeomjeoni TaxID=311194 RepID=UPI001CD547DF|nr:two-component system activity regulator YycH [Halobacillus yeomjeoni]MCA0984859.1 two-component system activity regulator YycH [Halobacillus yeomjeoni]